MAESIQLSVLDPSSSESLALSSPTPSTVDHSQDHWQDHQRRASINVLESARIRLSKDFYSLVRSNTKSRRNSSSLTAQVQGLDDSEEGSFVLAGYASAAGPTPLGDLPAHLPALDMFPSAEKENLVLSSQEQPDSSQDGMFLTFIHRSRSPSRPKFDTMMSAIGGEPNRRSRSVDSLPLDHSPLSSSNIRNRYHDRHPSLDDEHHHLHHGRSTSPSSPTPTLTPTQQHFHRDASKPLTRSPSRPLVLSSSPTQTNATNNTIMTPPNVYDTLGRSSHKKKNIPNPILPPSASASAPTSRIRRDADEPKQKSPGPFSRLHNLFGLSSNSRKTSLGRDASQSNSRSRPSTPRRPLLQASPSRPQSPHSEHITSAPASPKGNKESRRGRVGWRFFSGSRSASRSASASASTPASATTSATTHETSTTGSAARHIRGGGKFSIDLVSSRPTTPPPPSLPPPTPHHHSRSSEKGKEKARDFGEDVDVDATPKAKPRHKSSDTPRLHAHQKSLDQNPLAILHPVPIRTRLNPNSNGDTYVVGVGRGRNDIPVQVLNSGRTQSGEVPPGEEERDSIGTEMLGRCSPLFRRFQSKSRERGQQVVPKGKEKEKGKGQDIGKDTGNDVGRDAGKEIGRIGRDVGKDIGRDAGKDIGRDAGKDIGKDIGKGKEKVRDNGKAIVKGRVSEPTTRKAVAIIPNAGPSTSSRITVLGGSSTGAVSTVPTAPKRRRGSSGAAPNPSVPSTRIPPVSTISLSSTANPNPNRADLQAKRAKHGSFDFERPNSGGSSVVGTGSAKGKERAKEKPRPIPLGRSQSDKMVPLAAVAEKEGRHIQFQSDCLPTSSTTTHGTAPSPNSQTSVLNGSADTHGRGSWSRAHNHLTHPSTQQVFVRSSPRHRHLPHLGAFEFERPGHPHKPLPPVPSDPRTTTGGANGITRSHSHHHYSPIPSPTTPTSFATIASNVTGGTSGATGGLGRDKGKGKSLDLGLGLAWAPTKVREEAVLNFVRPPGAVGPGRSNSRMGRREGGEREEVLRDMGAFIGEAGIEKIERSTTSIRFPN
ncbi:hypothetical protein JAAARDRAFT_187689 [Jaapia argillacea MUCL 33604]|uniref:Uncharacterized protein n=1 Tax=Jaapia argillacea MUCL 33604 TaxID=933084 RepID=A0A067QDW8_9AGAM|nr:hypothetical protein JAAARDRAFT_187689 [Jaapia argillacea MUCL 33604]